MFHRPTSLDVVRRGQDDPSNGPRSLSGFEHVLRSYYIESLHSLERRVGRAFAGQVHDVREAFEAWASHREVTGDVDQPKVRLCGTVAARTTLADAVGEP